METYAHAIQDITLNEKILGTPDLGKRKKASNE
jgi:hypothetical protein